MDVDEYCERLAPGLWGEPLNAVSNAAFLIASGLLVARLVRRGERRPVAWALPVTLGVVGLCSLAFHTVADTVTGALDSLSILVFILVAVVILARWGFGVRAGRAWLAAPAFVVAAVAVDVALAAVAGAGATLGGYLPALLGLLGFAVALRSPTLGVATAVFAVSLTARTLDAPLCDTWPAGTHFLWHCLNAVVLALVALVTDRLVAPSGSRPPVTVDAP